MIFNHDENEVNQDCHPCGNRDPKKDLIKITGFPLSRE